MKISVEFESLGEFMAFGRLTDTGAPPAPTPAPTPPAYVPQTRVLTMPARAISGTLRWITDDTTYLCAVVTNGDIIIAALYSGAGSADGTQMTRLEAMLDSGLDTSPPDGSDAGLRDWLSHRVLPQLNQWLVNNRATVNAGKFQPVSAATIPASWSVFDRAAASLAQWVKITPSGFVLGA